MSDTKDKKLPTQFITVDNSVLYNELRSSIVSSDSWQQEITKANV